MVVSLLLYVGYLIVSSNFNVLLCLLNRTLSWIEAEFHCQSHNMTLFQYGKGAFDRHIRAQHHLMAQDFREVMFLGLTRNIQVCMNTVIV